MKLIDHCAGFSDVELDRELDGFGYPSTRLRLQYVIGAELYWVGVLCGLMVDERDEDAESIEALKAFRARVADVTGEYLRNADDAELNTPRTTTT